MSEVDRRAAALKVAVTVTLTPPARGTFAAQVSAKVTGTVALDGDRPGEALSMGGRARQCPDSIALTTWRTVPIMAMMESITSAYLRRFQQLPRLTDSHHLVVPVTGAQRRFCLDRRLDPQHRPNLAPVFYTFPAGTIDLRRLESAGRWLSARHPALRARLGVIRGVPVQVVDPVPIVMVARLAQEAGLEANTLLARALEDWTPDGPPLRMFLAGDGVTETLAVAFDHGVCDEQSINIVIKELAASYREELTEADVTATQASASIAEYEDEVRRQLALEDAASDSQALSYWASRLAGIGPCPQVPQVATDVHSMLRRLPGPISAQARPGIFPALLYACGSAARQLFGMTTPPLAYPWTSRSAESFHLTGCFINTVVFPVNEDALTSDTALPDVTARWWDDLDWADTPFDEVLRAVRGGTGAWSGQIGVLVTFEDTSRRAELRLGGTAGREVYLGNRRMQAPVCVSVSSGEDLVVRMMWNGELWGRQAGASAFDRLASMLSTALCV